MIRLGYQRHFAAAVESAASTGGQITPPIMGAAAFLMVEFLGIPYQTVILAATVPAFMHFFGVFVQVHFEAKRGLRGLTAEELPIRPRVIREGWPTVMPLAALLLILFSGFTPYLAAFWGITPASWSASAAPRPHGRLPRRARRLRGARRARRRLVFSVPMLRRRPALVLRSWLARRRRRARVIDMVDAFVIGAKYAIGVGAAAATVGIIVGVVTLTGVGFKISYIVTSFAAELGQASATCCRPPSPTCRA